MQTVPAQPMSREKAWPLESYTHIYTKHLSNSKLPQHLVSGKSTVLLASPSRLPKDGLQDHGDV